MVIEPLRPNEESIAIFMFSVYLGRHSRGKKSAV